MRLYRYLFQKFLPVFFGAMFFFSFLLSLIDLLMNISKYLSYEVSAATVAKISLLYIPQTLAWSIPLSILFAVAFTLSMLYVNSELTVIFASGISLFRFTFPLLIFAFILSIGFFFFEDNLVIPYYSQKVELQNQVLKKVKNLDNKKVVVQAEGGLIVYKADSYNDRKKQLNTVYIVIRNKDKSLNKIIYASSAKWKNNKSWEFYNAITYTLKNDKIFVSSGTDFTSFEPPETFQSVTVDVTQVNADKARQYIAKLQRAGLPDEEALSQYYYKYSFPFVIFIVVFLSIALTGKSRKNILLSSLILCVCATVIFYVMQMIFMYFARFGYVSPLVGAWFTVIVFVISSIVLLFFART
ncbi:MAG: permease [Treponema sp. CETP13]|nr:MAG: permease [Treponema sp. CETP13]